MTEMRTFRLDKLVRDGIVEGHEAIGGSVEYETLEGDRLKDALIAKLEEELAELKQDGSVNIKELADLREIIDALAIVSGQRKVELESVQYDKRKQMGGFAAGHFIHTVTVPAASELANYYESDPKRFPESK